MLRVFESMTLRKLFGFTRKELDNLGYLILFGLLN
jgi:hypothetical protein